MSAESRKPAPLPSASRPDAAPVESRRRARPFLDACRSSHLGVGFAGACAAGMFAGLVGTHAPWHATTQAFSIFLLAHSLGWKRDDTAAAALRTVAGMAWIADALVWIHVGEPRLGSFISGAALALILAWWGVSRYTRQRRDWIVLASALAVVFIATGDWLVRKGSPDTIAVAASLATFAVGIGMAWTRPAWDGIRRLHQ